MRSKNLDFWEIRKSELLENIDTVLEKDSIDKEVLEIMKELIGNTKVINTMEEYYEEKEI